MGFVPVDKDGKSGIHANRNIRIKPNMVGNDAHSDGNDMDQVYYIKKDGTITTYFSINGGVVKTEDTNNHAIKIYDGIGHIMIEINSDKSYIRYYDMRGNIVAEYPYHDYDNDCKDNNYYDDDDDDYDYDDDDDDDYYDNDDADWRIKAAIAKLKAERAKFKAERAKFKLEKAKIRCLIFTFVAMYAQIMKTKGYILVNSKRIMKGYSFNLLFRNKLKRVESIQISIYMQPEYSSEEKPQYIDEDTDIRDDGINNNSLLDVYCICRLFFAELLSNHIRLMNEIGYDVIDFEFKLDGLNALLNFKDKEDNIVYTSLFLC